MVLKKGVLERITDKELTKYAQFQRNTLHEKRLRILIATAQNPHSWSELMQLLDLRNPKILHDHLTVLLTSKLLDKNPSGFYTATKLGKAYLNSTVKQIEDFAELDVDGKVEQ